MGRLIKLAWVLGCAVATMAAPQAREGGPPLDNVLGVGPETRPPGGFLQFCQVFPADCRKETRAPQLVTLTPARRDELGKVNRAVNRAVRPVTDQEVHHVEDWWSYPFALGDCEDYVILKRKMLIKRGWPEQALLITVVKDPNGDGHAVLTVRTNRGDYVLDNLSDGVMTWRETGYQFVKRQAEWDPTVWVKLIAPTS